LFNYLHKFSYLTLLVFCVLFSAKAAYGEDIEVSVSLSPTSVVEGGVVTVTINLENIDAASNYYSEMNSIVPSGLTYMPGSMTQSPSGGSIGDSDPAGVGLFWYYSVEITPGSTATLTYQATADAGSAGTINIGASKSNADGNLSNNSDNANLTVTGLDVGVVKTASSASPLENGLVQYSLEGENFSTGTATNVEVVDVVPAGLSYVGSSIVGGDFQDEADPTGTGLIWDITNLASGAKQTLTYQARVINGASFYQLMKLNRP